MSSINRTRFTLPSLILAFALSACGPSSEINDAPFLLHPGTTCDATRCQAYEIYRQYNGVGSTAWVAWWIKPKQANGSVVSDSTLAATTPILLLHGQGMYDGYQEVINMATLLADRTQRPVGAVTEMVWGNQADRNHVDAYSVLTSGGWRGGFHNMVTSGTKNDGYTWTTAYPADGAGQCFYGDAAYVGKVQTAPGLSASDVTQQTTLCVSDTRATTYATGASAAIQMTVQKFIDAQGYTGLYAGRKFDALTVSAGGVRLLSALVNQPGNGYYGASGLYTMVRGVVTLNTPFFGIGDNIIDDLTEVNRETNTNFYHSYVNDGRLAGIHWWPLVSQSLFQKDDANWVLEGNYLLGAPITVEKNGASSLDWDRTWKQPGDNVVPTASEYSAYRNTHARIGGAVEDWGSLSLIHTGAYTRFVGDTTGACYPTLDGRPCYETGSGPGHNDARNGDHRFYSRTVFGLAQVTEALKDACRTFGGSCGGPGGLTVPQSCSNSAGGAVDCNSGCGATSCRDQWGSLIACNPGVGDSCRPTLCRDDLEGGVFVNCDSGCGCTTCYDQTGAPVACGFCSQSCPSSCDGEIDCRL